MDVEVAVADQCAGGADAVGPRESDHGARERAVKRSHLVDPESRCALLVDHAERSQSVIGVEHAEVVEVLDRHESGSSKPRMPPRARLPQKGKYNHLVLLAEESGKDIE
jgi:manganese-dependent inorganic pyrophosphatase